MRNYFRIIFLAVFSFLFTYGCANRNDKNKVQQLVNSNKSRFAPDQRVAIDLIEVTNLSGKIILEGITNLPDAKKALIDSLIAIKISFTDSIRVLPDSTVGDKTWGLVTLSVSNLRSEPNHPAELVSQALMGTPLKVLDYHGGWYRVQTPDYYIGWMEGSGLTRFTSDEMESWRKSNRYVFNRISGSVFVSQSRKSSIVSDLVMGDLLEIEAVSRGYLKIKIPDGRTGFVKKSDCISWQKWTSQKPDVQAIISVAKQLMGEPYLWGGTSSKSVDCSGLTKTAYFSQGVILARDASQQATHGEHPDFTDIRNLQPGDLLFFGRNNQHVTHVGLYLGNGLFVHSSGLVHISSIDPKDPAYNMALHKALVASSRILNSLNTEGIALVKDHPWYIDQK